MENADCAICEDCVYENNHPCPFEKYYENLVFCLLKTVNETDNSCEFFAFYHPSFTPAALAETTE